MRFFYVHASNTVRVARFSFHWTSICRKRLTESQTSLKSYVLDTVFNERSFAKMKLLPVSHVVKLARKKRTILIFFQKHFLKSYLYVYICIYILYHFTVRPRHGMDVSFSRPKIRASYGCFERKNVVQLAALWLARKIFWKKYRARMSELEHTFILFFLTWIANSNDMCISHQNPQPVSYWYITATQGLKENYKVVI